MVVNKNNVKSIVLSVDKITGAESLVERSFAIPKYDIGDEVTWLVQNKAYTGEIVSIYAQYYDQESMIDYEVWSEELGDICTVLEEKILMCHPCGVE